MLLWCVVLGLATMAACRLTRLVTLDDITDSMRERLARRGDDDLLFRLIRCPWCIGFWITLAAIIVAWQIAPLHHVPWWFAIPAQALAASQVVGWLAGWQPDD